MKVFYTLLLLFTASLAYSQTSQSNQYIDFDGSDDRVQLDSAAKYLNGGNAISLTGWFYPDGDVYGQAFGIRDGGTGNGSIFVFCTGGGKLECRAQFGNFVDLQLTTTAFTSLNTSNQWLHYAWIVAAGTGGAKFYLDGTLMGTKTVSGTFNSPDKPFIIGWNQYGGFKGRADEVSLWKKALSEAEVLNMMQNPLAGNETDLVAYYRFNQGTPGGNNTSITQALSKDGDETKHGNLINFALNGATSNFNGTLDSDFQYINFPTISNKLTTSPSFQLNATTNASLTVTYSIVSGPASVTGNTITLSGVAGTVKVKASQAGDASFVAAEDVYRTFQVLDQNTILPSATVLHPLAGDVFAPNLTPIPVNISTSILYPDLFSVGQITATIGGESIALQNLNNGLYLGWWTPTAYGSFDVLVTGTNNYGASVTTSYTINLQETASDVTKNATNAVWVSNNIPTVTVESDLPSHIGAYDQIIGTLSVTCPTGGCDPWDMVSSIEAQGKDGEWYLIIRYITPYLKACSATIDLTDFASILNGKTKFRVNLGTQGNGYLYTLNLAYRAGTAAHAYSKVQKLWYDTYQFGDPANLQPTGVRKKGFPQNTLAAKLKVVSTGHGWDIDYNSNNAAEFSHNTHNLIVNNGVQNFTQDNWYDCNPNPNGCNNQSGTWQYDRAGWCPGSIGQFFDYDLDESLLTDSVTLNYVFDETYVDACHPNNPNCVDNVTSTGGGFVCKNCDQGYNPYLMVNSYVVSFADVPEIASVKNVQNAAAKINLYPNPSVGKFIVDFGGENVSALLIYDNVGRIAKRMKIAEGSTQADVYMNADAKGIYHVVLYDKTGKVITTKIAIVER
ncbi:MAG: LamG-like jellyroll fold domain-containing protein [Bacteroidota bacterium]